MQLTRESLSVIDRIYHSVEAPEHWCSAVLGIADLVRADHAVMVATAGAIPFVSTARVCDDALARAMDAQEHVDPGPFAIGVLPAGQAVTRSAIMGNRSYELTAHYNEITRPLNGYHGLVAQQQDGGSGYVLVLCRPRRSRDFSDSDQRLLQAVVPHLSNALRLQSRLALAERRYGGIAQTLNRLDAGVILTDASARPLFVNDRAGRIAAEMDSLLLGNQVSAVTLRTTQELQQAINVAAAETFTGRRQVLVRRRSGRLPLIVDIVPISRVPFAAADTGTPRAAIFITEADAPAPLNRAAFAETFRMTPRESDIALLLATGADLPAIAAQLRLGLGTVRHHLKSVYEKTGSRGQAALVATLRGFANQTR